MELALLSVPAASSPCPDWCQFPADLLVSVFASLDVMDLLTAGAVCRSWREHHLVACRLGSRGRNQSPCLLYADRDRGPNEATLRRLSTGQLRHVALPDPPLRSRFLVGSSHGWLATANERSELILVNPINGDQIALPLPFTIKNVRGRYNADGVLEGYDLLDLDLATRECNTQAEPDYLTLEEGRFYFYVRVVMSADPSSGNCIVMILHMPYATVSYARVGDENWTWIDVDQRCCQYNGFFYNDSDRLFRGIRQTGELHTIDLNGPVPVVKSILRPITSLVDNDRYIVQAPWGDILQVWRYGHCDRTIGNDGRWTARHKVYTVDLEEQKLVETQLAGLCTVHWFQHPILSSSE
ncbi:hypothetical protein PR202_gb20489 [Eleusine coracana subsp. coracana]|uniref:F-box domain-containing protein n=1 Tax=Eleusine coracana subsp. coracana TaxID=191504 RepID=A0AAV5FCD6_ELECO|nr:hypothetical protein PR202_gb20489 [Eleusine coracana subsp. coracana]